MSKEGDRIRIRFVKRFSDHTWRMFNRHAIKGSLRQVEVVFLLRRWMTRSAIRYWISKFK